MDTKSTLEERLETLKDLNRNRFDFVLAYSNLGDVRHALKEIGMSKSWYYKYSEAERAELEKMGDELHRETALHAWYILASAAPEAAQVKLLGLNDKNSWIRQTVASDILDRTTKRLPAKVEVNHRVDEFDEIMNRIYGNQPSNS
jgi:hypothetical protein